MGALLHTRAGGKQLVLVGGHARGHEAAGRECALLGLDPLAWERPEGARLEAPLHGHSAVGIGRNRLLVRARARSAPACMHMRACVRGDCC